MPLCPILKYPDPFLRLKTLPVQEFNSELSDRAQSMLETMYAAPGVGLAAPQIGWNAQLFVMDTEYWIDHPEEDEIRPPEYHDKDPIIMVNPVITEFSGTFKYDEGCLSFPGVYHTITRPKAISVTYFDLKGRKHSVNVRGSLASVCIQHEIDHLLGKLFIDHMPAEAQKEVDLKFGVIQE